jgi:hypothetical protein
MTKKIVTGILPLKDIIGIQPMSAPVSPVYILRYTYHDVAPDPILDAMNPGGEPAKRICLEVISEAVSAKTRKLHAQWNIEVAQDLACMHDIDAEAEFESILSYETVTEIVYEQIHRLVEFAEQNDIQNSELHPNRVAQHLTKIDALIFDLNIAANKIAQNTRRGAGRVIVTSPVGVATLQRMKQIIFRPVKAEGINQYSDIVHVGDICYPDSSKPDDEKDVQYKVFMSLAPALSQDINKVRFLLAYKGGSDVDTGYIWCPYVPNMTTGVVVDPATFQPSMRMMTRYGWFEDDKSKDYYRLVEIDVEDLFPTPPSVTE